MKEEKKTNKKKKLSLLLGLEALLKEHPSQPGHPDRFPSMLPDKK